MREAAKRLGIADEHLIPYGHSASKVSLEALAAPRQRTAPGRLVLVSAITPTPAGEGKTTTTIGLGQAMSRRGASVCVALREPSMGPCFGIKGGGTGGGRSQIEPSDEINMHFTGDIHAVTSAHNLLAAMVDNHLLYRQEPRLNPTRTTWKRALDMNDRALRSVLVGLGGNSQGVPRESGFDITAASEVMAVLCLASDPDDLRARLSRILVGFDESGGAVTAGDIGATGAMMAILRQAVLPNLVQTTEGTPAFVHGGPFANIAHGCNSVLATRMAMHHADWALTEAGFGFDLGGEKFLDIKCQSAGLSPSLIVLVATVRALKMHGGMKLESLSTPDPERVAAGLGNLEHHLQAARRYGLPVVVAINAFPTDTAEEVAVIRERCAALGVPAAESRHFAEGGAGAEALAALVEETALPAGAPPALKPLYRWSQPVKEKIQAIAAGAYGADGVVYSDQAERQLRLVRKLGCEGLPVCMAKTHRSLSDNAARLGRPTGFSITVQSLEINTGAGLLVALTGEIVRMPGLPREPSALRFDVVDGRLVGLQ